MWVEDAACRDADPRLFFPETPGGGDPHQVIADYCRQCPVAAACLESALTHRETGIWGGLTEVQREGLRATGRTPPRQPPAVLTDRQQRIIDLTKRGMTATEVADRLGVSPRHVHRIRGQFGITRRALSRG